VATAVVVLTAAWWEAALAALAALAARMAMVVVRMVVALGTV